MRNLNKNYQKGQALITLLVFMIVGIIIVTSAIEVIFVNSLAASKMERGTENYYLAESGIENGILRLLRNPDYTGETLSLVEGDVEIQVVPGSPILMTATAVENNVMRKIQAEIVYNNGMFTISSWKEIY